MPKALRLAWLLLLLAAGAHGAHENNPRGRMTDPFAKACDKMTPAEWQPFLDHWAGEFPFVDWIELERYLRPCKNRIAPGKALACLERLHFYAVTRTNDYQETYSMGFELSTDAYLKSRPAGSISLPAEYLNGIPASFAETAATYHSPIVSTFRGVKVEETKDFTRFFLAVGRWTDHKFAGEDALLDVIAVDKRTKPHKIHFAEYKKTAHGMQLNQSPDSACVSCHISGLVEIHPVPGSADEASQKKIDAANARIRELVREGIDWDGTFVAKKFGPPMGKKQGCTGCHDGKDRGILTQGTSMDIINLRLVGLGSMPPSQAGRDLAKVFHDVSALSPEARGKVIALGQASFNTWARAALPLACEQLAAEKKITAERATQLKKLALDTAANRSRLLDKISEDYGREFSAWLREVPCAP